MLQEQMLVVVAQLPEDPRERARTAGMLAGQMARHRDSAIEDDAADELADLCNCDLAAMQSEIEKLATYVGAGRPIQRADVEALVVSEKKHSVWELAEVLATGQRARAFLFLANVLQQGEPAPALIGAMAWMYRKLVEASELKGAVNGWQAARALQMRPEQAELAIRNARRISRPRLLAGLLAFQLADNRLKSGSDNPQTVMEFLIAELTAV